MPLDLVATTAAGLEEILAGELAALGVAAPRPERGAVAFGGAWADVWRANWRLRTANRVLVELASWEAADGDQLARGAERLVVSDRAWAGVPAADLFSPDRTLALRATSERSPLTDPRWIGLRVKDGIVDAQRRRFGRRSSVDRDHPDLPLRVRVSGPRASLLLDTSGEPLDRRGYRTHRGTAPVREHLAAGCVLAAGWSGEGPVVDPMCGSGTLLAEAGMVALGLPPGRHRARWRFEDLPGFDRAAWDLVRREPLPCPGPDVTLTGVDRDAGEVAAARANLVRAGLGGRGHVTVGDGFDFVPPEGPGLLVVNPPYGERLEAGGEQWRRLGDLLKRRYAGWQAVVLAGGEGLGREIGLRPRRRLPVRNGPLAARILVFDLY